MPYWETPENVLVANMERTGYPDGQAPEVPKCPHCGEPADTFFVYGPLSEVVGCPACIKKMDVTDYFKDTDEEDWP